MRSTIIALAFLGLAAAIPAPDETSALEATALIAKRDDKWTCRYFSWIICAQLPQAYGPAVRPDNPSAFTEYNGFSQAANSATTPSGYLSAFQNSNGATSTSNYITWVELQKYDPSACSAKCDQTQGCSAFNIYFERDPSTITNEQCCPDPDSVTRIKCSLWGTFTSQGTANNKGQLRDSFHVLIAGSNGYNKRNLQASSKVSSAPASTSSSSARVGASSAPSSAPVSNSTSGASSLSVAMTPSSANASSPSSAAAGAGNASSVAADASSGSTATADSPSSTSAPSFTAAGGGPFPAAAGAGGATGSTIGTPVPSPVSSQPGSTVGGSTPGMISNSATIATAAAASVKTDPGSPVTASIVSSAAAASSAGCTPVQTPEITFNINRPSDPEGLQTVWMYGSTDMLGNWNPDKGQMLSSYKFTQSTTNWFVALNITELTSMQYKYFVRNKDWSITWPADANKQYTVPAATCQSQIVVNDQWQGQNP